MLSQKNSKKISYKQRIFSSITMNIYNPMQVIKNSGISFKDVLLDSFESLFPYLRGLKFWGKDLYLENLHLAKYHLENNHIFDAALRYKVAHFFNKKKIEPFLGLAEIFLIKKDNPKAKMYFQKAIDLSTSQSEKQTIRKIMEEL